MAKYRITLFEGDGIGPEITKEMKRIFDSLGLDIEYDEFLIGERAYLKCGELIPKDAIESIKKNKIALKAPVTTPIGEGFRSVNVELRLLFDLYVNLRPISTISNKVSKYKDVDLIIFRENTEDLYTGIEEETHDGFCAKKIITKEKSKRIINFAFDYMVKHNRHKITCVHKANILKKTDGLFLSIFNDIKNNYKMIESNDKIIDNMCMQLVLNPNDFDSIVAPNLYGDILSDLSAGLVGGLGLAPSANLGDKVAIFEAVHGSAPDIEGKGIANPTAFFLSGALMLEYLNEFEKALKLKNAIKEVIEEGKVLTKDLGGCASTTAFTDEVISKL